MRFLLIAILAASVAAANTGWTYPVPSINLDKAPAMDWYTMQTSGDGPSKAAGVAVGYGPHSVHGIELSDGSLISCGETAEEDGSSVHDAFAIRTDKDGNPLWAWKSNTPNHDDGGLSVAQLPGGGDVLVGGLRQVSTDGVKVYKRVLTKLKLSDGSVLWEAIWNDPVLSGAKCKPTDGGSMCHSATYWIDVVTAKGSEGLLISGFMHKPTGDGVLRKSSGVPDEGGSGFVMKLPLSALADTEAPSEADAAWIKPFTGRLTTSVKGLPDGGAIALVMSGGDDACAETTRDGAICHTLYRLDSDGETSWGPLGMNVTGQGSDVAVLRDSSGSLTGFAVAGLSHPEPCSEPFGTIAIYGPAGSAVAHNKYSSGANPHLVNTECWGINQRGVGGEVVMACGIGIEDCSMFSECRSVTDKLQCLEGKGDTRAGAIKKKAGVWRQMIVAADPTTAALNWQYVGSYQYAPPHRFEPEATGFVRTELRSRSLCITTPHSFAYCNPRIMRVRATVGSGDEDSPEQGMSSACEHVYVCANGDVVGVGDEGYGVGHMRLSNSNHTKAIARSEELVEQAW